MAGKLEVLEGLRTATEKSIIEYTVDTTNRTATPANTVVKCFDLTDSNTDVTTTVFPTNTPSESDETITLSVMKLLTKSHKYRVEVLYDDGGNNTFVNFIDVECVF